MYVMMIMLKRQFVLVTGSLLLIETNTDKQIKRVDLYIMYKFITRPVAQLRY